MLSIRALHDGRRTAPRRDRRGGHCHQHDAERGCDALVFGAGTPEESEDRHRKRGMVAASQEDGGAELAERDRERETGRDPERPQRQREVDLATDARRCRPKTAAASRRRGSTARSAGASRRTTNGAATSDWATGTIQMEPRKSSGAVSKPITKP